MNDTQHDNPRYVQLGNLASQCWCDCWGLTPWGTWERRTSAPCIHGLLKPAVVVQPVTTSMIQPGLSVMFNA